MLFVSLIRSCSHSSHLCPPLILSRSLSLYIYIYIYLSLSLSHPLALFLSLSLTQWLSDFSVSLSLSIYPFFSLYRYGSRPSCSQPSVSFCPAFIAQMAPQHFTSSSGCTFSLLCFPLNLHIPLPNRAISLSLIHALPKSSNYWLQVGLKAKFGICCRGSMWATFWPFRKQ